MKKILYLNTLVSLLFQICSVIIGLLLPRFILQSYGSEVNGLTNSIAQMLSVISLLDLGVGAVVQSALYKPIAQGDGNGISIIYSSAKKFFNIVAEILLLYVVILCIYYGVFRSEAFGWIYTVTLILAMAVSYFAQYYFGICNILLLNADQKIYIVTMVNLLGLLLNALSTIILLKLNAGIQAVKLMSSLIYLARPLILQIYVKKKYDVQVINRPPENSIPNKWSGMAQHVAAVLTGSVDNVVLTIFSTFSLVSVYTIYVMPLNSIRNLIEATSMGYKSFFGILIANKETKSLNDEFDKYEVMMHFFVVVVFTTVLRTLVPFVLVYTSVVCDENYDNLLFGAVITLAYAMYALRLPYTNIIFAAGKFKETQADCIIECILNIVISVALVKPLGLTGVAMGTVISSGYRMIISVYYLKKDILHRSLKKYCTQMFVDMLCVFLIIGATTRIKFVIDSFFTWCIYAAIIFIISLVVAAVVFWILKREKFNPGMLIKSHS